VETDDPIFMIRIAITPAAFEAIAATLPIGSVGFAREAGEKGERLIWVEAAKEHRPRAASANGLSATFPAPATIRFRRRGKPRD
jgi:hypothetical protein